MTAQDEQRTAERAVQRAGELLREHFEDTRPDVQTLSDRRNVKRIIEDARRALAPLQERKDRGENMEEASFIFDAFNRITQRARERLKAADIEYDDDRLREQVSLMI